MTLLFNNHIAFADLAGCGCYCGKVIPPPCGDDACKVACGWQAPASQSQSYQQPAYDYQAEQARQEEIARQRQAELDEQARKEAQEAKRRQEEFEQKKAEALNSMKGISENELGLKGISSEGDLGLKGVGETSSGDLGLKTLFDKPMGAAPAVDTRVKGPSRLDAGKEVKSTGRVDSSVVDLRDLKLKDVNNGLMKNQWDMSIDWRYKHDPVVQKYIDDLWATAFSSDEKKAKLANDKLEQILVDQLRANGRTPQEVEDFFDKVHTFLNGDQHNPIKWDKVSKLAQDMDIEPSPLAGIISGILPETEPEIVKKISTAKAVTADVAIWLWASKPLMIVFCTRLLMEPKCRLSR